MDESELFLAFQCNFGWTLIRDLTFIAEKAVDLVQHGLVFM